MLGSPSRNALKAVSVAVRWDDGREADERAASLRPIPKVTSRTGQRSQSAGMVKRPSSAGASPASARTGGSGVAVARPSSARQRPGEHEPRVEGHCSTSGGKGGSPRQPSASSAGNLRRSASSTGIVGASSAGGASGSGGGRPTSHNSRAQSHSPGGRSGQGIHDLPVGARVADSFGRLGTVVGPPSQASLRAVAVSVQYDNGRVFDDRIANLRPLATEASRSGGREEDSVASPPRHRPTKSGRTGAEGSGNSGPHQEGRKKPVEVLRRHSMKLAAKDLPSSATAGEGDCGGSTPGASRRTGSPRAGRRRHDSQWCFADPAQTIIIFDWDDTLFPTTDLIDMLKMDWRLPVASQRHLTSDRKREVGRKLATSERLAVEILQRASSAGHVVVVTLAAKGWVEQACRSFYPKVGELLRTLQIKIVNAMEQKKHKSVRDASANCGSEEAYYGLLKGRAIAEEIDKFYSQYEGQTWKNVLSIGDSRFERYGTLAASTAYMQKRRLSMLDQQPFTPAQQGAWTKVDEDDHVVKLRVKCCKFVDGPDMDELAIELDMAAKWLSHMVSLNEGFDLNFEALTDVSLVGVVESVLRGERPVTDMPVP